MKFQKRAIRAPFFPMRQKCPFRAIFRQNGAPARHFGENWHEIDIFDALEKMARVWRVFEFSHLLLKLPIFTKFSQYNHKIQLY